MVAVRWNRPSAFTAVFTGGSGVLTFAPGINIGIDSDDWNACKKHSVVAAMLQEGHLEELVNAPSPTGKLEGFDVVENKATGEPIPVQPVSKSPRAARGRAVVENLETLKAKAEAENG